MDRNVESLLALARKRARMAFCRCHDREDRIDDAVSTTWELALRAPERAKDEQIVKFAICRVWIRRQFRESARDLMTLPKGKRASRNQFRPVAFYPDDLAGKQADPAEIAALRIDYPAWLRGLSILKRKAAKMLAVGERTMDVARKLQVCDGRIAQIRRELYDDWVARHS